MMTIQLRRYVIEPGRIELQAHDPGRWIEYTDIKIRRL